MKETDRRHEKNSKKKNDWKEKKYKDKPSRNRNQNMREEIEKLEQLKTQLPELTANEVTNFTKLPLSENTVKGLKASGFTVPTKVQRQSLPFSLGGSDVVAAAKTGSGKTLAFIIPLLEKLYCSMWTSMDGLGALVVTPSRELAYQIFDVLNKVGKHHDFSAGLVIGGTELGFEWQRVSYCNILICTPGRLLQHMTENPAFSYENVQMLILDEADMCLSMGFSDSVNTILEELPTDRQTLLFSATQTRDVKDLIRAGCKNPVYCSVHEHSKTTTPKALVENYIICETPDKFTFLWSFITQHKKEKILVFLSTCKQVKYVFNMFCKLQPGLSTLGLHGNMKQLKRMAVYDQFCRKEIAVLFATDVAARGLDIPAVHWVIQADCPEDVTSYIHRAGRTARYATAGNCILLLTSSEEPTMVKNLRAKNIPIQQTFIDTKDQRNMSVKMDIVLAKYVNLKEDAVRAFKAYIKHIAMMKNKKVFNVLSVDLDAFARSLGLVVTPRVRFLERLIKQKFGSLPNKATVDMKKTQKTTLDFRTNDSDDDDDDNFLKSSKVQPVPMEDDLTLDQLKLVSKKKKKIVTKEDVANKAVKKGIKMNQKLVFDEEGNIITELTRGKRVDTAEDEGPRQGIDIDELKGRLKESDEADKKLHRQKEKEKKLEKKRKEREVREAEKEEEEKDDDDDDGDGDGDGDDNAESDVDDYTQDIIDSLPDPDKIYGKKDKGDDDDDDDDAESEESGSKDEESGNDEIDSEEEASDSESTEETPKISGKRKAEAKAREAKRAKTSYASSLGDLPVDEQEQLALYLLSGRK